MTLIFLNRMLCSVADSDKWFELKSTSGIPLKVGKSTRTQISGTLQQDNRVLDGRSSGENFIEHHTLLYVYTFVCIYTLYMHEVC